MMHEQSCCFASVFLIKQIVFWSCRCGRRRNCLNFLLFSRTPTSFSILRILPYTWMKPWKWCRDNLHRTETKGSENKRVIGVSIFASNCMQYRPFGTKVHWEKNADENLLNRSPKNVPERGHVITFCTYVWQHLVSGKTNVMWQILRPSWLTVKTSWQTTTGLPMPYQKPRCKTTCNLQVHFFKNTTQVL